MNAHEQSLLYYQLLINALMAVSLGVIFPYTVITTAKTLRYMRSLSAWLFSRAMIMWLLLLSAPFMFELINTCFGPWEHRVFTNYVTMSAALFTASFAVFCYHNRHVLQTLLPKEEFIIEQEKRQNLLRKMIACDDKMPLARFESRNGVILSANPWAQELVGYTLAELHKMVPGALVHPDDRGRALQNVLQHSGTPYECKIITASGKVIHAEIRTTHDPSDTSLHITFMSDVTNYVEEREKRQREYISAQATKNRRVAESNLMQDISQMSTV